MALGDPLVIATTNELTVKQWSEGLEAEVLKKTSWWPFVSKRSTALIQFKETLSKGPGDVERIGLRMQSVKAPVTSGTSVEGQEQSLNLKYSSVTMDELADAFLWDNIMSRQRVTFEHRDEARAALADQLANALDSGFFNQIAGITGGAATLDGNNPIVAPNAASWQYAGVATTEAGMVATDLLTLDDLSEAKQTAKLKSPAIRPVQIDGYPEELYVVFLHPWQVFHLKQADSRWDVLMRDAMQGGMIGNNPQITGALGIYDQMLLCENTRVPKGVQGTEPVVTRRAIFCGAQSALTVWGRIGGTPEAFRWVEKLFDFDRQMGVLGGCVAGLTKTVFQDTDAGGNPFDFATIVISSASPNEATV